MLTIQRSYTYSRTGEGIDFNFILNLFFCVGVLKENQTPPFLIGIALND